MHLVYAETAARADVCVCFAQLLMYLHDAEKTAVSSNKMGAGGLPKNQREVANRVRTSCDLSVTAIADQAEW